MHIYEDFFREVDTRTSVVHGLHGNIPCCVAFRSSELIFTHFVANNAIKSVLSNIRVFFTLDRNTSYFINSDNIVPT